MPGWPISVPSSPSTGCKVPRLAAGRRVKALAASALAVALAAPPALADGINVARDAETEALLQDYAAPIFAEANIKAGDVQIFIVADQSFNAFVVDSRRMFINTGAIIAAETPSEIICVLAHEAAHINHGDLASLRQTIARSTTAAIIAALLGAGAAAAGAAAGIGGLGDAAGAVMAGSMHVAGRNILAYARAQETAADAAALDYLEATGQSGMGMVAVMRRLADQVALSVRGADPYVQTHPLPADRLQTLEFRAGQSPYANQQDPPELQLRHDLVRAKLAGFTLTPAQVGRLYSDGDPSLPARYAWAIATYRAGSTQSALKRIDGLIAAQPDNAFFRELKGQVLLESGRPAEAVEPLRKAVSLAPSSGLLRILFGQALVATETEANLGEAVKNLTVGLQKSPDMPVGWRFLARAYALKGDLPMAELATAEERFTLGNYKEAVIHATRAQERLKPGSPAWLRAEDIVTYKPMKPL
ncbi:MAG: M48 family metallopeptidase [Thermomicrobiales bacterium]|nr:M48 family metallopeptidase [Thermomicrobiales bacterium]